MTKTAASHGGARVPRVTLEELVRERRFDAKNHRHRAALADAEDLTFPYHPRDRDLRWMAKAYQEAAFWKERARTGSLLSLFEETVRGS